MTPQRTVPILVAVLLLALAGCGNDPATPDPNPNPGDPSIALREDQGTLGVILDTRPIFKRGYLPATVRLSFPSHSELDTELDVDHLTNLAVLSIPKATLEQSVIDALGAGVPATVVVESVDKVELARLETQELILDDSNAPVFLTTDLPRGEPQLVIDPTLPYLLQVEGGSGFMELAFDCSDCYRNTPYVPGDSEDMQIFFTPVGDPADHVYTVTNAHSNYPADSIYWYMEADTWLGVRSETWGGPEEFALEPDWDGFVKIRHVRTGLYLFSTPSDIQMNATGQRFRLVTDILDWSVEDLGTRFSQPILAPAQLDFAYTGRLSNCSSAGLEEAVGRVESRTSTTTVSTTEGLELFSSTTTSAELNVSTTVTSGIGFEAGPFSGSSEVSTTVGGSFSQDFTTSRTTSTENTLSNETSTTVEVSRTRTVTVPEFTVVDVQDAIKTIRDVRVPFTQVLRIRATDRRTGEPATADAIRGQLAANHFSGVVVETGPTSVTLSLRGVAYIDQLLNASTIVSEVEGGCGGS
ncbi:MAG TPA: hypothetical protein P5571_15135 [Candidatus Krumholzibacteria bacterium]|nr:hypothetical protein [Candidatus Krumholzibacteria bacterium]HRX52702.1 hypothetical protein [Candidatus Krumholzibacteria bacterium]